ncbi:MAG: fibronectin type III domain-containing protein [Solirubrobacteraceae bacterium]
MRGKLIMTVTTGLAASLVLALTLSSAGASADGSPPTFVQQMSVHSSNVTSATLTPTSAITAGNRLVVVVGIWSSGAAKAKSVTDTAGNTYTEVLHFIASDNTEESVWTAPVTAGGATRPAITVTPTSKADLGAIASEYSGLSTAPGTAAVDQISHASGTTKSAASVASGIAAASAGSNELAVGAYVDSGFGDTLTAGSGFTQRANVSPASNMELLSEDQALPASGTSANASVGTGANTVWLISTVVFAGATQSSPPTVPGAPTTVTATGGDATATVSWTAPSNGGAPITSYSIIPYVGSTAQAPTTVTGTSPATTATVSGLSNGTTYTFTVTATNSVGTGSPSAQSNGVTPSATSGGRWGPLLSTPMTTVHSILMDNGKVLQFDGWQQPEPSEVYDPSTGTYATQTAPDSVFCSGVAELPDGRVLVIGGYGGLSTGSLGIVDTSIFDPSTNTWSRVADMHSPRWYPDLTELPDGRYVATSGNSTDDNHWADAPEIFDPSTGQWTVLTGISTSQVHEEEYPFSYLIPNGNVFTIGPAEDASFELNPNAKTWTQVGGASGVVNGSSVMYLPGRVLYSGGAANLTSTTRAAASTATIDLTSANPLWHQTAPMAHARIYHTLTMLADGTVLAVGGEPTAGQTGQTEVSGGILPSEIWDPSTQTWSPAAATATTRGYHSTALLMPDGSVLVGGSGHANAGFPAQLTQQVYSPAYLFTGARPTISAAPSAINYGASFNVSMGDASTISAVNLVSLGADTHQSDMDQHFVPLTFTQNGAGLTVQAPSGGTYAPPGHYMLFILNSNGVPAIAPIVSVSGPATAPGSPAGVTAAALNGSAVVSWTAPANGGATITSYTVTPYVNGVPQPVATVTGNPAATTTTVTGLTNGTTYTFTVSATNSAGTSAASGSSNAVTPSAAPAPVFVQRASGHTGSAASLSVSLPAVTVLGDRLIVETGIWNSSAATARSVTDSAGDTFTKLTSFKAADDTEESVWSAPVAKGSATPPTVTVTPTSTADVGAAVLEYAGLSPVSDATVVDQAVHAVGKTGSGTPTVSSGATAATTGPSELAVGFYADSGFGDTLAPGAGFVSRVSIGNVGDMELLAEDQIVSQGATANATVTTGASTYWLMSTVVLKTASVAQTPQITQARTSQAQTSQAQTSQAPISQALMSSGRVAHARRGGAAGRAASSEAGVPPPARAISHRHATVVRCGRSHRTAKSRRACASLRHAASVAKRDRRRWIYEALLKHLSTKLLCHWNGRTLRGAYGLAAGWYAAR